MRGRFEALVVCGCCAIAALILILAMFLTSCGATDASPSAELFGKVSPDYDRGFRDGMKEGVQWGAGIKDITP